MGCVMGMLGELQLGRELRHPCTIAPAIAPRAATRLGLPSSAAARALPDCGLRSAALAANPCTCAASTSSMSIDDEALPCHSSPEQHGERGIANDEQMGRGVAGECWRAHQVRHCHRRGQRTALAEEGDRSLMLSGSLAQSCSLARLTVHALLAHFRLLMSDLENLRHACARAQIFQVRQQDSKGIEHSMYRKTVLTHFEEKRQHLATYTAGPTPSQREASLR